MPLVFSNFRDLSLPWIASMQRSLVSLSHECIRNCDLDLYFELLTFTRRLTDFYGVGALGIVQEVAF